MNAYAKGGLPDEACSDITQYGAKKFESVL